MRALLTALLTLAFGLAARTAHAAPTDPLALLYATYLAGGRSDVEIHLSAAGPSAVARVRAQPDGSFSCHVSGLQVPSNHSPDAAAGPLQAAGLLVHEVTHCLVGPYLAELRGGSDNMTSAITDRWVLLTAECISDARAVIEVFRRDGASAAKELVALMLPQRTHPKSWGHSTALALNAALARAIYQPETLATPDLAFAAALGIGLASATETLDNALHLTGQQDVLQTPALRATAAALDAALARSLRAFTSGRFANTAVTIRALIEAASAADTHVFAGPDDAPRSVPVISAEGAHSLGPLRAMLASGNSPQHRLAAQWLLRDGRLDAHTLAHSRSVFARFIRSVSEGTPTSQDDVVQVLEEVIADSRAGEGISAVLEAAAERIRSATPEARASLR